RRTPTRAGRTRGTRALENRLSTNDALGPSAWACGLWTWRRRARVWWGLINPAGAGFRGNPAALGDWRGAPGVGAAPARRGGAGVGGAEAAAGGAAGVGAGGLATGATTGGAGGVTTTAGGAAGFSGAGAGGGGATTTGAAGFGGGGVTTTVFSGT